MATPAPDSYLRLIPAQREHRRIGLIVALVGLALPGLGLGALALLSGQHGFIVPAGLILTTALITLLARRRLSIRLSGSLDNPEDPRTTPGGPGRLAASVLALVGIAAIIAWRDYGQDLPMAYPADGQVLAWLNSTTVLALALLTVAALALMARFYGTTRLQVFPEAAGLASWMRLCAWLTLLRTVSWMHAEQVPWLAPILGYIESFFVFELLVEFSFIALFARSSGTLLCSRPISLRLFFGRFDPLTSFFAFLTEAFGIDLRGSWALAFIRRSLAPMGVLLIALTWMGSAFTLVGPGERGIVEVFGARPTQDPLGPGLHLGWPWPLQTTRRVSVDRVLSLPIGFTGAKGGASLLWTAQHAAEEYKLLLGDGHDLISVNATLHYSVGDPLAYTYSCAQPTEALRVAADEVLMAETVGRSLEGALSENLTELASRIESRIQQASDELQLGFTIVDLTLMGLHPPVSVAKDYQAVVGARIDRNTRVLEAEAYSEKVRPSAHSQAYSANRRAEAEGATRVARATGEAAAFGAVLESYQSAPELFTFRRFLEAREAQLSGRQFVVIDQRFERDGGALWINGAQVTAPLNEEDF